ncbi:MAG: hypothetical protein WDO69_11705 [Pseudomonadota bacterium]
MDEYDQVIDELLSLLGDQDGVVGVSVEFKPEPILYVDLQSNDHRRRTDALVPTTFEGLPVRTRVRGQFVAQAG